ncbi:hypothetical protein H0H92_002663 [Tricholoma furcatifolium]|nr:hypothetical protein H0H92_002663 [Tricholoma furcatifolium]
MHGDARPFTFRWVEDTGGEDSQLFQTVLWSRRKENDEIASTRLIVAIQPPWVLSDRDMEMFTKLRDFPPSESSGCAFQFTGKLSSEQRLWAKLYDVCVEHRTRWFVLTSYNTWCFGVFSPGWNHAFVSHVFKYDARDPSVVKVLMFWIASSMRMAHTKATRLMPEPITHVFTPPNMKSSSNVTEADIADSESHWTGKDDEASSSAGVFSTSDNYSIMNDLNARAPFRRENIIKQVLLRTWVKDLARAPAKDPKAETMSAEAHAAGATTVVEPNSEDAMAVDENIPQAKTESQMGDWIVYA